MPTIHSVTVTGERDVDVSCEFCSEKYFITVSRTESGSATSLGLLSFFDRRLWRGRSHADIAQESAVKNTTQSLETAQEPSRCPACGEINQLQVLNTRINKHTFRKKHTVAMYTVLISGALALCFGATCFAVYGERQLVILLGGSAAVSAVFFVFSLLANLSINSKMKSVVPPVDGISDEAWGICLGTVGAASVPGECRLSVFPAFAAQLIETTPVYPRKLDDG